jgi:hypothetical protein
MYHVVFLKPFLIVAEGARSPWVTHDFSQKLLSEIQRISHIAHTRICSDYILVTMGLAKVAQGVQRICAVTTH